MSERARQTLEADAWMSVVHAYLACQRRYAQMLEHYDLTIAQFEFLAALRRHPDGVTPRVIAEELLVTKGNITGLIGRLEARELVHRRPHASDGRSFICELTGDGLALCRAAGAAAGRFVRAQLAPFADVDLERTRDQMLEMRAILDQLNPDAMAHPEITAGGKAHHA
ncbi:MAG: MarR family transcriptional regulator [Pseudomonadota bacterium]